MSVKKRELDAFGQKLTELKRDVPEILSELLVGEGVYAVGQARKICKNEAGLVNTGAYRYSFHTGSKKSGANAKKIHDGSKPRRRGKTYKIDVYNNIDYAKYLEYGFRSHFVPGHWEGKTFVYERGAKEGMFVGRHPPGTPVLGHHTLRRAVKRTESTSRARMNRRLNKIIKSRFDG